MTLSICTEHFGSKVRTAPVCSRWVWPKALQHQTISCHKPLRSGPDKTTTPSLRAGHWIVQSRLPTLVAGPQRRLRDNVSDRNIASNKLHCRGQCAQLGTVLTAVAQVTGLVPALRLPGEHKKNLF